MNLDTIVQEFLASRKQGRVTAKAKASPRTLEVYSANLARFINWMAARDRPVLVWSDLTKSAFLEYLDYLESKEQEGKWSRSTVLQNLRVLRSLFHYINKDDEMKDAHVDASRQLRWLPRIEKAPKRQNIPTMKVVRDFVNSFRTSSLIQFRDYVMTNIILETGIRIGEVCNIKIEDLYSLDENFLIVTGKKTKRNPSGKRKVALTTNAVRLVRAWQKRRKFIKSAAESEYLFVSKYKDRVEPAAWANHITRHCKKHKIGGPGAIISAHRLRHVFATNFLKRGGDMEKLRQMTGHADYQVIQDYYLEESQIMNDSMRTEVERVSIVNTLKSIA